MNVFTLPGAKWELSPGGPSLWGLNLLCDSNHKPQNIFEDSITQDILHITEQFLRKKITFSVLY